MAILRYIPLIPLLFSALWHDASAGELKREFTLGYHSSVFLERGPVAATQLDIDALMAERVPEEERGLFLQSAERIGQSLENILIAESLYHQAEADGILSDELIQARLRRAVVTKAGTLYRERFLKDAELEDYEAAARELFLTRRDRFLHPTTITFDHFMVSVGEDRTESEAMRKVANAHDELINGHDFAALALAQSDDPTVGDNDGTLTGINPAELVPQLAATLGAIEPDTWSDPVRTRFGWHLVRLREVQEGERMSWEEARPRAVEMARERHLTRAWERKLRDLQEGEPIFTEGAVAQLRARYGLGPDEDLEAQSRQSILQSGSD